MVAPFFSSMQQGIRCLFQTVKHLLRHWTKPRNDAPVLNTALDLTRSIMTLCVGLSVAELDLLWRKLAHCRDQAVHFFLRIVPLH
jgi:hypothetical protein